MSLFNKISDLFFEEIPGSSSQSTKPVEKSSSNITSTSSAASASTGTGNVQRTFTDDKIYQNFCEILDRSLEENNLPGFDFFEFLQLYNKFIYDGKSEDESVKTALTSAETMRVDKNALIANYQHYKKALENQKKIFEQDLNNFLKQNINGPKEKSTKIDEEIIEKQRLIKQYEQDIENLKKQKADLGLNVDKAELQVNNLKVSFDKAYGRIFDDLNKVHDKLKSM